MTRTPSQVRYENEHPRFSARLPKAVYDSLIDRIGEQSNSDFLLQLLETGQTRNDIEKQYQIVIPCSKCGKPMIVEPGDPIHQDLIAAQKREGSDHCLCGECAD